MVVTINNGPVLKQHSRQSRVWLECGHYLRIAKHVTLLLQAPISEECGYQLDLTVSAPGKDGPIVHHFEDIADTIIDLTGWARALMKIAAIEYRGTCPARVLLEFHDVRRMLHAVK